MAPDELQQVLLDPETEVNADTLAGLLSCTSRHVLGLAKAGVIVRSGRGVFRLLPSIVNAVEKLRGEAAGRASGGELDLAQERARLAKEQADATALKNAVTRGELVSAADAEAAWIEMIGVARGRLLAIPSKLGPALAAMRSPTEVQGALEAEIHAALAELASLEVRAIGEGAAVPDGPGRPGPDEVAAAA